MNKVILSGRLTRDPEVKTATSGNAYTRVSIAVDRQYTKEKGNEKGVDFIGLVVFGKTAEFMGKYFTKGSKILVEGRLQTSHYQDKNGEKRSSTDVIVDAVEFADSKKKDSDGDSGYQRNSSNGNRVDDPMEDYPF